MISTLLCRTRTGLLVLALAAGVPAGLASAGPAHAEGLADTASATPPPAFAGPAEAVTAFRAALAGNDLDALARLLGLDAAQLRAEDGTEETFAKIRAGADVRLDVEDLAPDRKILEIGADQWPLPFPLVRAADGRWAFDTRAGLEEITNRRIGENELAAIETMRAYVEAQRLYAQADHDGDGVPEYAQRLISTPGQTDGLYWPDDQGDGPSPGDAAIDPDALDKAREGKGYFGYRFRILRGQGAHVAGGHYDYVINGNMIAGFGLIAWPVSYGETGVHTFVVNQAGIVYERDLGPRTERIVRKIRRFDPDAGWEVVDD